ncbi:hypothetical protein TTHERM_00079140 (macronuclear) [Tetrahymena thermophila SB210]|uniref:Uncharacterized protein n=1 Tax=Tetrahymena thermophila (strain SB210) TaxID=312017 RepID=Q23FV0_TETTS|nr:hypothetical protein TTHERM_00079140 [Tetrahymena thermophila SB210]EAR95510.2 hypothetical protein TTHERM_00079140 [Tetrahymena thermophila SB210]|eukprot:XP_001015755.2 hypothetical protein TTHERM_00079140 [Tetrahymena thermophila SB210]
MDNSDDNRGFDQYLINLKQQIENETSDERRQELILDYFYLSENKQYLCQDSIKNDIETPQAKQQSICQYKDLIENQNISKSNDQNKPVQFSAFKQQDDQYDNKPPYYQYNSKQKDQNRNNLQQNNTSKCSIESEITSNISDTNQQNIRQQLQIDLQKENENLFRLEEKIKKIDQSNATQLVADLQDEIELTKGKIISLQDQIQNSPSITKQQAQDQKDQSIQPIKTFQIQYEGNKQDFLNKPDNIQMRNGNQNNFLLYQAGNFEDESQIRSQSASFYQRENVQVLQNGNSYEETQTQGMDPNEDIYIEKRSNLEVELKKKIEIQESLIMKIDQMSLDEKQSSEKKENQKQIQQIEQKIEEILNQLDMLGDKLSKLKNKQQNQNSNSKISIESQSKYNQNINSKRGINQLENNFDMTNEVKTIYFFDKNIAQDTLFNKPYLPDQNSQGITMNKEQQRAESYQLDRGNGNNNSITIYAGKKDLQQKGFTEGWFHKSGFGFLRYDLFNEPQLFSNILNHKYDQDKKIKIREKYFYEFIYKCLININEEIYGLDILTIHEKYYFKKFISVLKEYLKLRNMQITKIYQQESQDENINSLFITSSNENEVLITELYLRNAETEYKLMVDYQGFYLGKIREQQSLQEGLFPQKKVRLCLLPLREIKQINFYEFEEQDVKQLQNGQTKIKQFRKSMFTWLSNDKYFSQNIQTSTEELNGQQVSLVKFVDLIIQECNKALITKYYDLDNSENILASNDCNDDQEKRKGINNFKKYYLIHILLFFKVQKGEIPPQVEYIINELQQKENTNQDVALHNDYRQQMYPTYQQLNQNPYKRLKHNNYNINNNSFNNRQYYNQPYSQQNNIRQNQYNNNRQFQYQNYQPNSFNRNYYNDFNNFQ